MRGGVEAELDALRRERRRLETLAELESLKRSLAAVAEGREDQNIDPDETRARVAARSSPLSPPSTTTTTATPPPRASPTRCEACERRSTETRATRSPQTTRRKLWKMTMMIWTRPSRRWRRDWWRLGELGTRWTRFGGRWSPRWTPSSRQPPRTQAARWVGWGRRRRGRGCSRRWEKMSRRRRATRAREHDGSPARELAR